MSRRIIISGATGFIGSKISKKLIENGDDVVILSRSPERAKKIINGAKEYIYWNEYERDDTVEIVEGSDAIIHLAGTPLNAKRWNEKHKSDILRSRQITTRKLAQAILKVNNKPEVFISTSATGYYGNQNNKLLNEKSENGNDFLSSVCYHWENETNYINDIIRKVIIRVGIVLSTESGALKSFLIPFKLFIGGPLGNGKQWMSWIHVEDIVSLYLFALNNKSVNGILNGTTNTPVTMNELTKTLGKVLKRPSIFPVPEFALKMAIGEMADVVLASQKVNPERTLSFGFNYKFTDLETAIDNLIIK